MKIKNTEVESTPFAHIEITDKARQGKTFAWFKMYWSNNKGVYGYQVCYQGNHGDSSEWGKNYFEGKTGGYGYSKESQALQDCIRKVLGKSPYSCHYEAHSLLRNYRKGGNFYKLSIAQLRKVCKAHH